MSTIRRWLLPTCLLQALLVVVAPTPGQESSTDGRGVTFSAAERRRIARHSPLPPPPPSETNRVADDPRARHLGRFLFFEPRLSSRGIFSCASCHAPDLGFGDQLPLGRAIGEMPRHSMSLWNLAYQRWFFWDGRTDSLWSQALQPLEHPDEMGGSRLAIAHLMASDPELRKAYEAIFGGLPDLTDRRRFPAAARPVEGAAEHRHAVAWASMTPQDRRRVDVIFANVGKSIAAYERQLVARDSPFDRFAADLAAGEETSDRMSVAAQRGLRLFIGKASCRVCHSSPTFSDGEFHNNGVPPLRGGMLRDVGRYRGVERLRADPFNSLGAFSDSRDGVTARRLRGVVNGSEQWGAFKTPGLRNVALGAPYMHQGQLATLHDVVRFYSTLEGQVQVGHHRQETVLKPLGLSAAEIDDLVAFMQALTDDTIDPLLLVSPPSPMGPDDDGRVSD